MGDLASIVQLDEKPEPSCRPRTPVEVLTDDCENLRVGVDRMAARMGADAKNVRYAALNNLLTWIQNRG